MKYLIILFSLITFTVKAQTKLDSLILEEINNYRLSLGLNKVEWDQNCYLSSNNQAEYLFKKNTQVWPNLYITHNGDVLPTPNDRYKFYSKSKDHRYVGEIICIFSINFDKDNIDYKKVAKKAFEEWKSSPDHHECMKMPNHNYAGSACLWLEKHTGFKNVYSYRFICVTVFLQK